MADLSVTEQTNKALGLIQHHIGLNGVDVHADATSINSGFMPARMYKSLKAFDDKRTWVDNGTDILTLEKGFYEGAGLINHPDFGDKQTTRISIIDVFEGLDGRKKIDLVDSFSNHHWTRTIHTDGTPDDAQPGWARVRQYTTLWSGYSDLAKPVTFAMPLKASTGNWNFSELEVKFSTGSNETKTDVIELSSYAGSLDATTIVNGSDTDSRISVTTYEGYMSLTNNTAVLTDNWGINIYPNINDEHDARIQQMPGSIIHIKEIRGIN